MNINSILWMILGALFVIAAEISELRHGVTHGGWYGAAALAFTCSFLQLIIEALRRKP